MPSCVTVQSRCVTSWREARRRSIITYGETIKAVLAILGHASALYMLGMYVGYVRFPSIELSNRSVGRLADR